MLQQILETINNEFLFQKKKKTINNENHGEQLGNTRFIFLFLNKKSKVQVFNTKKLILISNEKLANNTNILILALPGKNYYFFCSLFGKWRIKRIKSM